MYHSYDNHPIQSHLPMTERLKSKNMKRLRRLQVKFYWTKVNSDEQGHHELSGKNNENKSFKPNQIAPSIYIMVELCFFSLHQWEIKIYLLCGKYFNIPHWPRSHSTNRRLQHIEKLSKTYSGDPHLDQTKLNGLLLLTIHGVLTICI